MYESWSVITQRDGLPHDSVRALRFAGGSLWVGTDGGLARWDGARWQTWTPADGLPWPIVSAIDVDERTRDVWLGTLGGGLVRLTAGRFDHFHQLDSGLPGDVVFAVAAAGDLVWAATNAGLCSYDLARDEWDLYAERRADAPETVAVNLFSADGGLYVASWCEGLRLRAPDGRWSRLSPVFPDAPEAWTRRPEADRLLVAADASSHAVWWAGARALIRRDADNQWQMRRPPDSATARTPLRCLAAHSDTEAWLGTDKGLTVLASWNDDAWFTLRRARNGAQVRIEAFRGGRPSGTRTVEWTLPDERVRCIAFDRTGVWIGTPAGLVRGTDRARWDDDVQQSAPPPDGARLASRPASLAERTDAAPAIAVFAPLTRVMPLPGETTHPARPRHVADLEAVRSAIDRANARRDGERPGFVLVTGREGFDRYGWGTPEDDLIYFANRPDVSGLVAALAPQSRIATALLMRTEVPVVNAAATPASIDERLNPWVYRCPSNDAHMHDALLDHVFREYGAARLAAIRTPDAVSRLHIEWWTRHARTRGFAPVLETDLDPASPDWPRLLDALRESRATVVLTWCDGATSAMLLRRIRAAGLGAVFIGSGQIVSQAFIDETGSDAGTVLAIPPCRHHRDFAGIPSEVGDPSATASRSPRGLSADVEARFNADATFHLMEAIGTAGPERTAVQAALRRMGTPRLALLEGGRWKQIELPVSIESESDRPPAPPVTSAPRSTR